MFNNNILNTVYICVCLCIQYAYIWPVYPQECRNVCVRVNETCHLQSSSCWMQSSREHAARVQPAERCTPITSASELQAGQTRHL